MAEFPPQLSYLGWLRVYSLSKEHLAKIVVEIAYNASETCFHQGLLPLEFSEQTGLPLSWDTAVLTIGAMADSAYEYFLKVWLLTGKKVWHELFICDRLTAC